MESLYPAEKIKPLDEVLNYKRSVDVPYFTPAEQFRLKNSDGTIWMKNAPLYTPRLITEQDHADHDDEHKAH